MLGVEDVYALRHKVFVEGKSQRQVAREMGFARDTVRRYLATPLPEPRKRRRSRPVLEQVRPRLEQLLEEWSERTTAKQRITGRRLQRALREEGYKVGLTLVLEYLREWRHTRAEVYVPLVHRPGESAQVDFFEVTVELSGARRRAWLFLMRLMHSGRDFVRLYERQDQLAFLDGHVRAFTHFGGVPRRTVYDNLSAVVRRVQFPRRALTDRFQALASHDYVEPSFARPGEGHDQGGVESRGRGVRLQVLTPIPRGDALAELSERMQADVDRLAPQRVWERIFALAESGRGITEIARTLNAEGVANPTGRPWSKNGVHILLTNVVYTGALLWGLNARDQAPPVRVEDAFPAIVSKELFSRVQALLRSRAPRRAHPRRVGSSYLLSGLVRCKHCRRALSGQDSKSGKFSYYVCQSLLKRGRDACEAPRLSARRFERLVVDQIRANILTESNIRDLVRLVGEELDGVAREQRQKLEIIESELADVRRRLDRLYHLIETTELDISDVLPRVREHKEHRERLEVAAFQARAGLRDRRAVLDDVDMIAAYAQEMSEFLATSELTESKAFIRSFVKEIAVAPGAATIRYTIPMPEDSPLRGGDAEEVALGGPVLSTVKSGGSREVRPGGSRASAIAVHGRMAGSVEAERRLRTIRLPPPCSFSADTRSRGSVQQPLPSWRRGWDSNPRGFRLPLFESGTLNQLGHLSKIWHIPFYAPFGSQRSPETKVRNETARVWLATQEWTIVLQAGGRFRLLEPGPATARTGSSRGRRASRSSPEHRRFRARAYG